MTPAAHGPGQNFAARISDVASRGKSFVMSQTGWRRAALACVAGLLSDLAFAPFFLWPVLFITLAVLTWLIAPAASPNSNWRSALRDGWWFGFGFFFGGLFWIGEAFLVEADQFGWLLPFAVTLLPAGLALFYAAASAVTHALWRPGVAGLLVMAVAFSSAEWLRGHVLTGFPWNVLGYALTSPLVLMQSAAVVGIYGLTLLAVVIFTAPLVLATKHPQGHAAPVHAFRGVAISAGMLACLLAYGNYRLSSVALIERPDFKVRIVQPSVLQREKWLPEKQREIFETHLGMSRKKPDGTIDNLEGVSIVVWPEAAMPFRPLDEPKALAVIGELLPPGTHLYAGGLRLEQDPAKSDGTQGARRAYNSLIAFGSDGEARAVYDKIHLVPFGEYLPFQPLLEAIGFRQLTKLRGGFADGAQPRPLIGIADGPAILGLICYEAIFPAAVIQGRERPDLIVNVTNDGWFGNTTGPRQHLHQARVRAVEEGVAIARAANNGISALIDPVGRVTASLGLDEKGVIDGPIAGRLTPPIYARFGDLIYVLMQLGFAVMIASARRGKFVENP